MKNKFRAWHIHKQIMYEVIRIDFEQGIVTLDLETDDDEYYCMETDWSFSDVEIMQSTGLKDADGVEIFEGDIVHLTSDEGIDYNALIVFKDGGFCAIDGTESNYGFRRYDLSRFDLYLDVIGNVHENLELLEEQE